MALSLKQLKPNQRGVITSISGSRPLRRRLMDMGITPGTIIIMRKVAPLGDPIEITIRGYELSIRKAEADLITIERAQEQDEHN